MAANQTALYHSSREKYERSLQRVICFLPQSEKLFPGIDIVDCRQNLDEHPKSEQKPSDSNPDHDKIMHQIFKQSRSHKARKVMKIAHFKDLEESEPIFTALNVTLMVMIFLVSSALLFTCLYFMPYIRVSPFYQIFNQ